MFEDCNRCRDPDRGYVFMPVRTSLRTHHAQTTRAVQYTLNKNYRNMPKERVQKLHEHQVVAYSIGQTVNMGTIES